MNEVAFSRIIKEEDVSVLRVGTDDVWVVYVWASVLVFVKAQTKIKVTIGCG